MIDQLKTTAFLRMSLAVAIAFGAASAASAGSSITKDELVGLWQSPSWKAGGDPVFVQFKADGTLTFNGTVKWVKTGQWLLLDSGEVQVVTGGKTQRCGVDHQGKSLTLSPAGCFYGWEDIGARITLEKQ